jgi:hypothetical protein
VEVDEFAIIMQRPLNYRVDYILNMRRSLAIADFFLRNLALPAKFCQASETTLQ